MRALSPLGLLAIIALAGGSRQQSAPAAAPSAAMSTSPGATSAAAAAIEIPESVRVEHRHILERLDAATEAPGATGEAARALEAVLEPHFEREEEIALPPLGLLRPLAMGEYESEMDRVLLMTDALRRELPQMLQEHESIGAATRRLEAAARQEGREEIAAFARELQLHAQTEEQVLYPAAILVGEIVRDRSGDGVAQR